MPNQVFSDIYVSSSSRFNDFEFDDKTYVYLNSKMKLGITSPVPRVRITDMERTVIDSIKTFQKLADLKKCFVAFQ